MRALLSTRTGNSQGMTTHVTIPRKVEAAGIEREDPISHYISSQGLTQSDNNVSALCLYGSDAKCRLLASGDTRLNRVIELWAGLPEVTRQAIFALVVRDHLISDSSVQVEANPRTY